jgi:hypothetical protein
MRKFTKREDKFLRDNHLTTPAKRMATMLGRTEGTAKQRMKLLGIVTPPEVIERFKEESRFKKGSVPPNKGRKWSDFMSEEAMKQSLKTTFKKGSVPPNYKPVGSERIDKDGYLMVKVREGLRGWDLKHRHVYRLHFGEIPKGYNVEFKDRNRLNCEPSNLVLRTRVENMKINTYHNYPKEIASTIQLMGALKRQINKHAKNQTNEK